MNLFAVTSPFLPNFTVLLGDALSLQSSSKGTNEPIAQAVHAMCAARCIMVSQPPRHDFMGTNQLIPGLQIRDNHDS